jgi:hypothetical protein
MQPIVRVVLSAVVMSGAVVTEHAHAQPSDTNAIAERLFYQGRDLVKAVTGQRPGECAPAQPRLTAATKRASMSFIATALSAGARSRHVLRGIFATGSVVRGGVD